MITSTTLRTELATRELSPGLWLIHLSCDADEDVVPLLAGQYLDQIGPVSDTGYELYRLVDPAAPEATAALLETGHIRLAELNQIADAFDGPGLIAEFSACGRLALRTHLAIERSL